MVQAGGGVMVWGMFLGTPFVPTECRLNVTAYLNIAADHVRSFMTTVYPFSDGSYSQQDNTPCHKVILLILSNWFLEHKNKFTVLQ